MLKKFLTDIKKFRKYVIYSGKSGLKSEVAGSHLGWIWWILEPSLFCGVYWFVFGVIYGNKTDYFPAFIFVGLSLWNYFNKAITDSVSIIHNHQAVVTKVYMPKYMLLLSDQMRLFFKLLISLAICVALMVIFKITPTIYIL